MKDDGLSVQRAWFAIDPEGVEHELLLQVRSVQKQEDGDWTAFASPGVLGREDTIHGIDSWQAMEQAMRHVAHMVKYFQTKGWRFYWERGGEEALPSHLARDV